MKAFFLPCAVCGALESERVLPKTDDEVGLIVEAIVICRGCGFVYRRPTVPRLSDQAVERTDAHAQARAVEAAAAVSTRLALQPGDLYLEIDCGAGWFSESLRARIPSLRGVLLEANISLTDQAKRRNMHAVLLPSLLQEADLPPQAFSLVVARDADHRFIDHRKSMDTILGVMKDGATLYIERSAFLENWSNDPSTNSWFGRDQFVEYLREFIDLFEVVDLAGGARGVYGKRRTGGEKLRQPVRNRYSEYVAIARSRL